MVIGDLAERLGLLELIDGEIARERRARPVKTRRRGVSPGGLLVSLAECQLVGGAFFDHLEDQRADRAGVVLRAVGEVPSAPAALQLSKRFRRVHCQRVERAMAAAGERLDTLGTRTTLPMLRRSTGRTRRVPCRSPRGAACLYNPGHWDWRWFDTIGRIRWGAGPLEGVTRVPG